MSFRLGMSNLQNFFFFYIIVFRNSVIMMKMTMQRKRTQMICTNWWLQTQTKYLISLVIFVKTPFCISKEALYFCSNTFFYVHIQTMIFQVIFQEKLISAKNATKRYVTFLYLTKLIFHHLWYVPLWKRGWNLFPHIGNMSHFLWRV